MEPNANVRFLGAVNESREWCEAMIEKLDRGDPYRKTLYWVVLGYCGFDLGVFSIVFRYHKHEMRVCQ